jgi:hypothetical protein
MTGKNNQIFSDPLLNSEGSVWIEIVCEIWKFSSPEIHETCLSYKTFSQQILGALEMNGSLKEL